MMSAKKFMRFHHMKSFFSPYHEDIKDDFLGPFPCVHPLDPHLEDESKDR